MNSMDRGGQTAGKDVPAAAVSHPSILEDLYFDTTDLVDYFHGNATPSGIQRFAIEVIRAAVANRPPGTVHAICFRPEMQDAVELPLGWFLDQGAPKVQEMVRQLSLSLPKAKRLKGFKGVRYVLKYLEHIYRTDIRALWDKRYQNRLTPLDLPANAHVVVLGAVWNFRGYADYLARQKATRPQMRLSVFVHDLIPWYGNKFVGDGVAPKFLAYMRAYLALADRLVCNSNATLADVRRFAGEQGLPVPPSTVVPLAHEFPEPAFKVVIPNGEGPEAREGVRRLMGARFVLCVGTIEERKNSLALLKVWNALAQEHPFDLPLLVFAGRSAEHYKPFMHYAAATGWCGGQAVWLNGVRDGELAWLYENCLFTVFPSFMEGWGLPVGESLWFGKPCVASNTSSLPEVGGDLCDYVDPADTAALHAAVRRMTFDAAYRESRAAAITAAPLRTWSETCDSLIAAISAPRA